MFSRIRDRFPLMSRKKHYESLNEMGDRYSERTIEMFDLTTCLIEIVTHPDLIEPIKASLADADIDPQSLEFVVGVYLDMRNRYYLPTKAFRQFMGLLNIEDTVNKETKGLDKALERLLKEEHDQ